MTEWEWRASQPGSLDRLNSRACGRAGVLLRVLEPFVLAHTIGPGPKQDDEGTAAPLGNALEIQTQQQAGLPPPTSPRIADRVLRPHS